MLIAGEGGVSHACPQCGSLKVWKDGVRQTSHGDVQRWLCRDCGFRFSESKQNVVIEFKVKKDIVFQSAEELDSGPDFAQVSIGHSDCAVKKALNDSSFSIREDVGSHVDSPESTVVKHINSLCHYNRECQCMRHRDDGAKNMAAVETRQKQAAGATKHTNTAIDGNIINYAWHLKKQGYPETTIKTYATSIKRLHHLGADLMNPDSVKLLLANHTNWKNSYKRVYINAYTHWTTMVQIDWNPPHYKA